LQESQPALSGIGGGRGQVLVDGSLGEGDVIDVALSDQAAQDFFAVVQVWHPTIIFIAARQTLTELRIKI
jgi:hypothetical protein